MDIVSTDKAPAAIGPYSQAIISNGMLYASGQIPIVPETGKMTVGTIEEQAKQVISNIRAILAAIGITVEHVVKTTCYLTNMDNFAAFNAVYAECFTHKPARSCVAVSALPLGALVEIEITAEI